MVYRYGITNGLSTTLVGALGIADPTATMGGPLSGSIGSYRYNCVIDSEIIGFTACDTTTWTVLERGVSGTTNVGHANGAAVRNQVDYDYLQHLATNAFDAASLVYAAANFT
jgi:hypothetical protein